MKQPVNSRLKGIFDPTPALFTARIDRTMRTLPQQSGRQNWRAAAWAAAAVAVCAGVALLVALNNLQPEDKVLSAVKDIKQTATAGQTAAPALVNTTDPDFIVVAETDVPAPTPPPVQPAEQLQVTPASAVPTGKGWQLVAVAGKATRWYANPQTGELARSEGVLKPSIYTTGAQPGQMDCYSFLPSTDGRWAAFTVHQQDGDRIWLVTSDGRRLRVPEDIHWMHSGDSNGMEKPQDFDFTGMKMTAVSTRLEFPQDSQDITADSMIDDFSITMTAPDGSIYTALVKLDTYKGYKAFSLNDRRGYLNQSRSTRAAGEAAVSAGQPNAGYDVFLVQKLDQGVLFTDDSSGAERAAALSSNRFSMFKGLDSINKGADWNMAYALFVYQDDPARTLWELNLETGKAIKVADECLAADWTSSTEYWYVTKDQANSLQTLAAQGAQSVSISSKIDVMISANNTHVMICPKIEIINRTKGDLAVPPNVLCDLEVCRDGEIIWQHKGDYKLSKAKYLWLIKVDGNGHLITKPENIPSGYLLEVDLVELPYAGPGDYTLKGTFYNQEGLSIIAALPDTRRYNFGVDMAPKFDDKGKLTMKFTNHMSREYTLPIMTWPNRQSTLISPPTLYYRLFYGDKQVDTGLLPMTEKPMTFKELTIQPGKSYTLVEPGKPHFANIPAGEYRLEGVMLINYGDEKLPWGFAQGEYFKMEFTVPAG